GRGVAGCDLVAGSYTCGGRGAADGVLCGACAVAAAIQYPADGDLLRAGAAPGNAGNLRRAVESGDVAHSRDRHPDGDWRIAGSHRKAGTAAEPGADRGRPGGRVGGEPGAWPVCGEPLVP